MRYGIALVVAAILIAVGATFVKQTQRSIDQRVRQSLREARADGSLPPEIDPEQGDLTDVGLALSSSDMHRLQIANALLAWRFALIAIAVLGSLGIAHLLGRRK